MPRLLPFCLLLSLLGLARALLSVPRLDLVSASTQSKMLFGGGRSNFSAASDVVDIFDSTTNSWNTTSLSAPRFGLASVSTSDLVLFAGGYNGSTAFDVVDMFNVTSGIWVTAQLSLARNWLSAASTGPIALFAGGTVGLNVTDRVDIFDARTGLWNTSQLSVARSAPAAGSAGTKILFAGGSMLAADANFTFTVTGFSQVDIYDSATGNWSVANLSVARWDVASASSGDLVLFAGGDIDATTTSDVVDIYNASSNTWTTSKLSMPRASLAGTALGNLFFFGGGTVVDVYNASSGEWISFRLTESRTLLTAASGNGKVVFAGGTTHFEYMNTTASAAVDIFDVHNLPPAHVNLSLFTGDVVLNYSIAISAPNSSLQSQTVYVRGNVILAPMSNLSLQSNATLVVEGNLTLSPSSILTISNSSIEVQGCVTFENSTIHVQVESFQTPLTLVNYSCSRGSATITASLPPSCEKVTYLPTYSNSSLALVFDVQREGCTDTLLLEWWVILLIVLGVVIVVAIIALVLALHPGLRKRLFPYRDRKKFVPKPSS